MSNPQVVIGAYTYDVYVSSADATKYFTGRPGGAAWTGYSGGADDLSRAIVGASRMLDRQRWLGAKTSSAQPIEWPRTGITDRDGVGVDPAVIPLDIADGALELALQLLGDPTVQDNSQAGSSNVKQVMAKGSGVTFFSPVYGSRLPTACAELIAPFLASSQAGGPKAFGAGAVTWCAWDCNGDSISCCGSCGFVDCVCPQIWRDQFALDREPI